MAGTIHTGTAAQARPAEGGAAAPSSHIGDPIPIALGLFGFGLAVFWARFADVSEATLAAGSQSEALNYALLAASIAEAVAGIIAVIRGALFPGYVTATFGLWLFGLFFLVTAGAAQKDFTPDALGWYALILVVPVAIMAVPPLLHRQIGLSVAFLALIGLLLLFGIGYHDLYVAVATATATKTAPDLSTSVDLVKASAWFAFVAAGALWWLFARDVYEATGVLPHPASTSHPAPAPTAVPHAGESRPE